MIPNRVKEKLKSGQPSVGAWINIGHPAVAEIMADAGFEWLALENCEKIGWKDGRHSSILPFPPIFQIISCA
jgi:hypothetical protein